LDDGMRSYVLLGPERPPAHWEATAQVLERSGVTSVKALRDALSAVAAHPPRAASSELVKAACAWSQLLRARSVLRPLLGIALRSDLPVEQRADAAWALVVMPRGPASARRLVAAVQGIADEAIAHPIVRCLGLVSGKRMMSLTHPMLVQILQDSSRTPLVRGTAAEGLVLCRHAACTAAAARCLEDGDANIRFWGAYLCGLKGLTEVEGRLRWMAAHDTGEAAGWWSVAKEAANALCLIEEAREERLGTRMCSGRGDDPANE